jgi:histidinol-phosphate aminotransferase
VLKLDSNEATVSPSPRVTAAIVNYIQNGPLNWYPDVESEELCDRLASYVQIPKEYILTFNGSDHALETIARTFLSVDDEVIWFVPTYDHFRIYAESCDAKIVGINEDVPGILVEKIIAYHTAATRMVYLVNPNNPTGRMTARAEIVAALTQFPQIVFVVDEAYFEFCRETVADLVIDHSNLIVTRSFSKAFGLAGLRCGYLIAHPDTCAPIAKIRIGKNINAVAQVAACAALDDLDSMERYVFEVNAAKTWMAGKLRSLGLVVRETPANYILIRVAEPAKVLDFLEEQNIYIRDRSSIPLLRGFMRLTIGHLHLMERVWRIFSQIPQEFLFTSMSEDHSTIKTLSLGRV